MEINEVSRSIIACGIALHRALGPGLLESVYKECLYYEISRLGLSVEKEKPLPLIYHDVHLECGYRVDLFVEGSVIVEIKALETIHPVHVAQVLTYLKLSGCTLGLLLNFNVPYLKDGIRRVIRS